MDTRGACLASTVIHDFLTAYAEQQVTPSLPRYHDNKVLSLFSASNYHGELSNFGAYVTMDDDLVPEVQQFKVYPPSD